MSQSVPAGNFFVAPSTIMTAPKFLIRRADGKTSEVGLKRAREIARSAPANVLRLPDGFLLSGKKIVRSELALAPGEFGLPEKPQRTRAVRVRRVTLKSGRRLDLAQFNRLIADETPREAAARLQERPPGYSFIRRGGKLVLAVPTRTESANLRTERAQRQTDKAVYVRLWTNLESLLEFQLSGAGGRARTIASVLRVSASASMQEVRSAVLRADVGRLAATKVDWDLVLDSMQEVDGVAMYAQRQAPEAFTAKQSALTAAGIVKGRFVTFEQLGKVATGPLAQYIQELTLSVAEEQFRAEIVDVADAVAPALRGDPLDQVYRRAEDAGMVLNSRYYPLMEPPKYDVALEPGNCAKQEVLRQTEGLRTGATRVKAWLREAIDSFPEGGLTGREILEWAGRISKVLLIDRDGNVLASHPGPDADQSKLRRLYFMLDAGHCWPVDEVVVRELYAWDKETGAFVRRCARKPRAAAGATFVGDYQAVRTMADVVDAESNRLLYAGHDLTDMALEFIRAGVIPHRASFTRSEVTTLVFKLKRGGQTVTRTVRSAFHEDKLGIQLEIDPVAMFTLKADIIGRLRRADLKSSWSEEVHQMLGATAPTAMCCAFENVDGLEKAWAIDRRKAYPSVFLSREFLVPVLSSFDRVKPFDGVISAKKMYILDIAPDAEYRAAWERVMFNRARVYGRHLLGLTRAGVIQGSIVDFLAERRMRVTHELAPRTWGSYGEEFAQFVRDTVDTAIGKRAWVEAIGAAGKFRFEERVGRITTQLHEADVAGRFKGTRVVPIGIHAVCKGCGLRQGLGSRCACGGELDGPRADMWGIDALVGTHETMEGWRMVQDAVYAEHSFNMAMMAARYQRYGVVAIKTDELYTRERPEQQMFGPNPGDEKAVEYKGLPSKAVHETRAFTFKPQAVAEPVEVLNPEDAGKAVVDLVARRRPVLVIAELPGAGKSTAALRYTEGRRTAVVCPTRRLARDVARRYPHVETFTLHRWFGLDVGTTRVEAVPSAAKKEFECVVFDEVWCAPIEALVKMQREMRSLKATFIATGDGRQLPPVGQTISVDYMTEAILSMFPSRVRLNTCYRLSDATQRETLKAFADELFAAADPLTVARRYFREIKTSELTPDMTIVSAHNSFAELCVNRMGLRPTPGTMWAYRGRSTTKFAAGECYEVIAVEDGHIVLETDGEETKVSLESFGRNFRAAQVSTAHALQGVTTEGRVAVAYDRSHVSAEWLLVSVSRCTDLRNVVLVSDMNAHVGCMWKDMARRVYAACARRPGSTLKPEDYWQMLKDCSFKCALCAANVAGCDHIDCINNRGVYELGSVQPLCARCNQVKGHDERRVRVHEAPAPQPLPEPMPTEVRVERVNVERLRQVVANWDNIPGLAESAEAQHQKRKAAGFAPRDGPRVMAEKYLAMCNEVGEARVQYSPAPSNPEGRWFVRGGLGLQAMHRPVRKAIAEGKYVDIDIENAYPVLMEQWCRREGVECPMLTQYVTCRDPMLHELMVANGVDRDAAKQVYLSLLMGGRADYERLEAKPPGLQAFAAEVAGVMQAFAKAHPEDLARANARKQWNPEGSVVSWVLQRWENAVLDAIENYFWQQGVAREEMVKCFDGLMVPVPPEGTDLDRHLRECEVHIEDVTDETLGWPVKVRLAVKPLTSTLEL